MNPLIPQGALNRALGSVSFLAFPQYNVTASFLGAEGITASPDGPASDYIGTMTGAVQSPRLYQIFTIMIHLLRSQGLAAMWEQQRLTSTNIGAFTVNTDSPTLPPYPFLNGVLMNVNELPFNGTGDDYPLVIQGTYVINASLFV